MHASYRFVSLIGVVGLALVIGSGCSKSIDAGSGSQSFDPGAKKSESPKAPGKEQPAQAQAPAVTDEQPAQAPAVTDESLKGFQKEPKEERIGGGGTMVAKADTSDSGKQVEERQKEQAAAAAAGLLDVFFGYDSWKITDEGKNVLAGDAEWIKANSKQKLLVEGHCDERGTQAYNLVLGEKRAKSVRNYLVELGVSADRLAVRSYGKEKPFCKEHDESCYQQNRRAHVIVRTQ